MDPKYYIKKAEEEREETFDEKYPGEQEDSRSRDDVFDDRLRDHCEAVPW